MRTYVCTYARTHIHLYMHAYMHTCIHACMHPSIHPSIHTYIHTYICIYIYIIHMYIYIIHLQNIIKTCLKAHWRISTYLKYVKGELAAFWTFSPAAKRDPHRHRPMRPYNLHWLPLLHHVESLVFFHKTVGDGSKEPWPEELIGLMSNLGPELDGIFQEDQLRPFRTCFTARCWPFWPFWPLYGSVT